ncbi:MAG TPA: flagellar biosynthesis anti-sigma factor FlgM [Chloroflexota bacterium]|jgi:flagellar biosynthesis anti-sigma factor FlgM|nr:flagellar biosynthesis anti-sigma factor FlgM [Chloroflexota bacterium]
MEIEPIGPSGVRPPGTGNGVPEVSASAPARRVDRAGNGPARLERGDTLELSARARELLRARLAVEQAPEVRAERVAALRQRLATGTYSVSPEQLARKLLGGNGPS